MSTPSVEEISEYWRPVFGHEHMADGTREACCPTCSIIVLFDEIERLRLAADARICSSCLERHPIDVMCPPHETRTTGQEWFRERLREKDAELSTATRRLEIAKRALDGIASYGLALPSSDISAIAQQALEEMERVK